MINSRTGEIVRWAIGLVLAGLVAYFTAVGTIQVRLGTLEEREQNHYSELLRRLDRIEAKLDRGP